MPEPLPSVHSVTDDPSTSRRDPRAGARRLSEQRATRVGMRPLGVLLPDGAPELPRGRPQPRAELAKWVADPDNPLTARVMVNRIWQYHFGRGIVATPNDFGRMGDAAHASGTAGLPGERFVEERMAAEADAPADPDQQRLPAGIRDAESRQRPRRIRTTGCCGSSAGGAWRPKRSATPCCRVSGKLNRRAGGRA